MPKRKVIPEVVKVDVPNIETELDYINMKKDVRNKIEENGLEPVVDGRQAQQEWEDTKNELIERALAEKHLKQLKLAEKEMNNLQKSVDTIKDNEKETPSRSFGEVEEDKKELKRNYQ